MYAGKKPTQGRSVQGLASPAKAMTNSHCQLLQTLSGSVHVIGCVTQTPRKSHQH